jgi:hypothetical protein
MAKSEKHIARALLPAFQDPLAQFHSKLSMATPILQKAQLCILVFSALPLSTDSHIPNLY